MHGTSVNGLGYISNFGIKLIRNAVICVQVAMTQPVLVAQQQPGTPASTDTVITATEAGLPEQPIAEDRQAIVLFSEDLTISTELPGVLKELKVSEGDLVSAKDVLGVLDDRQAKLELQLSQMRLQLAQQNVDSRVEIDFAELAVEFARRHLQRAEKSQNAMAETELDDLRFNHRRGDLALEQAEREKEIQLTQMETAKVQKDLAEHQLNLRQMRAPGSGVVVELYARPGEFLEAGEPLLRLVRNDVMRVSAAIPLAEASLLDKGMTVRFLCTYPTPRVYQGHVIFVSPEAFGEVQSVKVLAEIETPQRDLKARVDGVLQVLANSTSQTRAGAAIERQAKESRQAGKVSLPQR